MARITFQQFGQQFIRLAVTAPVLTREFNKAMGNKPLDGSGKEGPASYLYTGKVVGFVFQQLSPEELDGALELKMDFKLRPLVGLEQWRLDIVVPFRIRIEAWEPLTIYLNHTTVAPEHLRITREKVSATEIWWGKVEPVLRKTIADEVTKGLRESKAARTIDVLKQIQGNGAPSVRDAVEDAAEDAEALRWLAEVDLSKATFEPEAQALAS